MTEHTQSSGSLSPTSSMWRRHHLWWPVVASVVVGLAVGIATQILQGGLPDAWGVLANSGVMWALTAFAFGAVLPTQRWAALGSAVALVIASITYYVAVDWFEGTMSDARGAIIWSAAGIVAGPVFGVAGHWFARRAEWRYQALSVVSGVLFGEGIHLTWFVGNPDLQPAGVVELTIGAVLATVCLIRSARSRARSATPIVAALTIVAATATLAAVQGINGWFLAW